MHPAAMKKHVGNRLPWFKQRRIKVMCRSQVVNLIYHCLIKQQIRQKAYYINDQQVFYNWRIFANGDCIRLYIYPGYFSNRSINSFNVNVLITGLPFNAWLGIWQAKS
jgi:hypothetical protein